MNFKTLHIHRYNDGPPTGKVEFQNELGEISLKLDDQMVKKVLQVCAQAIIRVSKQAADEMTAKVIDEMGIDVGGFAALAEHQLDNDEFKCSVCGETMAKNANPLSDCGRGDCPLLNEGI